MKILISNDDGIYSPGLRALAKVASKFGQVVIAAPDVEQSSMSQAITSSRPLRYKPTHVDGFEAYRVNGTPSDCVALGIFNWKGIDLVLSGINLGTNLGNAIWHSGTLAAAKQGALLNVRGIAYSMPVPETDREDEPKFTTIVSWVERTLKLLLRRPEMRLVNVNIPDRVRGVRWTRQSCRQYDGKVVAGKDPSGRPIYWYTVSPITEPEVGTDRWAFDHGFVTLTPLRLDLTDDRLLALAAADPEREADPLAGSKGSRRAHPRAAKRRR